MSSVKVTKPILIDMISQEGQGSSALDKQSTHIPKIRKESQGEGLASYSNMACSIIKVQVKMNLKNFVCKTYRSSK